MAIYSLCAVTCLLCAWLLLRGYYRNGHPLLFWSGLCFALLTLSNSLNVVDHLTPPDMSLVPARLASALAAVALILFALIWERE